MFHALKSRAELLAKIRQFFVEREVLEVETPLLGASTIPDPNIHSFTSQYFNSALYLQTSPEFAMKRLLAAGSGSIYQICKAFRNEDCGKQHNPEFTMLEWYRVGFDHHQLMDEMDALLRYVLGGTPAERLTYAAMFEKFLQLDPHAASLAELQNCAVMHGINKVDNLERDDWLNLLLTHLIEPHLGKERPTFIYDYPASQAALAQINNGVAERFEVYIDGLELANGFHELGDAKEQRARFEADLAKRRALNSPEIPLDEEFLAALASGFPACAGVALGIDRLLMVLLNTRDLKDVLFISLATN
ncbi:MAG: EF-P lysine aminoacylase GenX [Gammaproteobacteria bacterium]|nr:EF-P lysine aminoacylase GenX [Gammaproteobacteria bacterium]